jgi:uncharacterized phage protein gp47/JayE
MPPNITLDYSGRDYTSNYQWLLSLLRQYVPELTDLNASDAGISLLRLLARETDQLNLYMDQVFAEGFITSAKFYQSIIDLAKLVDVLPKISSAATTEVIVSWCSSISSPNIIVTFPVGYQFNTIDSAPYCTLTSVQIDPSTPQITVPVYQGTYVSLTINPSDFSQFDLLGRPMFNLGAGVAARTISVTTSDGNDVWAEVDSFYRSFPTDLNFRLELYADNYNGVPNTVFLVLGDGNYGSGVPSTPMQVSFVRTDGLVGNRGAGTITVLENNDSEFFTCTNPAIATGGSGPEDQEVFRTRVPLVVQTQRRGVTQPDYTTLVVSIPGVIDCQCADRNQTSDYPWEYLALSVLPSGGGTVIPPELNSAILTQLTSWGTLGGWEERYQLTCAVPVPVPISCNIGVVAGYTPSVVVAAVTVALNNLFTIQKGVLGNPFSFGNMDLVVGRVPGVSWVQFLTPTIDVEMAYGQYPVAGAISVTVSS